MAQRVRPKRPIRFRSRAQSSLTQETGETRSLLFDLAEELRQLMIESLEALGVSRHEQMTAYRRAKSGANRKKTGVGKRHHE